MADRNIRAIFTGDASSLLRANQQVATSLSGLGGKVEGFATKYRTQIGIATAAGAAAIVGFASKGVAAASDLEEAQNKVNVIFGESADEIEDWASTGAKAFGLSKRAALEATGTLGNMFTQLDLGTDQAKDMSTSIVGLAADFASFHNADITQVLEAQSAAFRGEYDALQRFVPTINAAAVQQQAMKMGLAESTAELTQQDKALATYELIVQGAGAATGDFARTSGNLANAQRTFGAQLENVQATLGEKFLPLMTVMLNLVNATPGPVLAVGAGIVVVGTAVGALLLLLPVMISGFTAIIALGPLLGAAMTLATGPVGLLVLGIAALIAAGVLLVKNWDWVKEKVTGAVGLMTSFIDSKFAYLTLLLGPVGALVMVFKFRDQFVGAFQFIQDKVGVVIDWVMARVDALVGAIQRVIDAIASLPTPGDAAGWLGDRFRAAGGPVAGGSPYIVGERGPELFIPNSSGNIVPNHALGQGGGGGGIGELHIHVDRPHATGEEIANEVMGALGALYRGGRLPGSGVI